MYNVHIPCIMHILHMGSIPVHAFPAQNLRIGFPPRWRWDAMKRKTSWLRWAESAIATMPKDPFGVKLRTLLR